MKFGLFLSVQHPVGESLVRRLQEAMEQLRLARDVGFDLVCTGQHYLATPYQALQSIPLLARASAESGDMRVAATVILLPLYNPVDIAELSASMDVITGGRFILGVGLGYRDMEYQAFGMKAEERVSRFTEVLGLIKRLWTEDEVTFEGRYFKLNRVTMTIRPVQKPYPPIWIAANTDSAVIRAARLGHIWLANPHSHISTLERQARLYRDTIRAAGMEPPEDLPLMKEMYVADTTERAIKEARPYLEGKYRAYQSWGQDRVLPPGESFDLPFEELAKGRFIIGDPEECIRQIREHQERLGNNWTNVRVQWPGMDNDKAMKTLELMGKHVIPAFR